MGHKQRRGGEAKQGSYHAEDQDKALDINADSVVV